MFPGHFIAKSLSLESEREKAKMGFCLNDKVHLQFEDKIVGYGIISNIDPLAMCHGTLLGEDKVTVQIEKCFSNVMLPYPHMGAKTLEESLNTFALWPRIDIIDIKNHGKGLEANVDDSNIDTHEEMIDDDMEEDANENEDVVEDNPNLQKSLDYTKRCNWYLLPVILMTSIMESRLARGIITLCLPTSVVDNSKIGEDHVGVTIVDLESDLSSDDINHFLPNYISKSSYLIKWPLHLVYVEQLATTLDKIIGHEEQMEDEEYDVDEKDKVEIQSTSSTSKRPYHFIKRRGMSAEEKMKKINDQKASRWIQEEQISKVLEMKCCREECCKSLNQEKIVEARSDFYGNNMGNRTTYIYDVIRSVPLEVSEKGNMIFDQQMVCRAAFYTIYGFSKATFYNYLNQVQSGFKVGFHRNKGSKKPRMNTLLARANLSALLESLEEAMPHLPYVGINGTSNICFRLPSCYSKKELYDEVNQKLQSQGESLISIATFHKIWREQFGNFSIHKSSAFAKCETCAALKIQLMKERRTVEHGILEKQREDHMNR